ncbi:MAG: TonB family protein [Verrucomicrobia bacterium]|nr:TonB family protein [Verrucomicrobiota bacterium]
MIPATIAAALHAGLLFGIGRTPPVPKALDKPITIITEFLLTPETPPPDLSNAVAGPSGGTPRPSLGEPPPVDTLAPITVAYTPSAPSLPDIKSDLIPSGPVGIPGPAVEKPGVGPGGIVGLGDLDNTPRTRMTVTPNYPFEAKRAGLTGEVLVEFVVDETGGVHAPRVVRSTDRVFEEAALRAVARWKFEAGKRGGKPVRFRMALPIVFSLSGD